MLPASLPMLPASLHGVRASVPPWPPPAGGAAGGPGEGGAGNKRVKI